MTLWDRFKALWPARVAAMEPLPREILEDIAIPSYQDAYRFFRLSSDAALICARSAIDRILDDRHPINED